MEVHQNAIANLNDIADKLYSSLTQIEFENNYKKNQSTNRPIAATITDKDVIGHSVFQNTDINGDFAITFISIDHVLFGLKNEGIDTLDKLISALLKIPEIAFGVSVDYIEKSIFDHLRAQKTDDTTVNFWEFFKLKVSQDIKPLEVIVPLHGLEVDVDFRFSGVSVLNFSNKYFIQWADSLKKNAPNQKQENSKLISKMCEEMQGRAAIKVLVNAESGHAHNVGFDIANSVCQALLIYSPARMNILEFSNVAPYGTAQAAISHTICIEADQYFQYRSSMIDGDSNHWHIDHDYLQGMSNQWFNKVFELSVNLKRNKFQDFLWSIIVAFSKSISAPEIGDRIAFRMSALESMLLKDKQEPISQSVADRMAFLLSDEIEARREIARNFKAVYKIRSDYVHHRNTRKDELELKQFSQNSWITLIHLIAGIDKYNSKDQIIEFVENKRYGG